MQQKKDAEISSLKRKLLDQKDEQKKTLKKLRKEHEQEKTKIEGQSSKLRLTTKTSKQREKISKIYFQREKNKVIKMRKQFFDVRKVSGNYVKKLQTMKQENQSLKNENETLKMKIDELNEQVCERESTQDKLSSELHQLETSCQYLETLLHDHESVAVFEYSDSNSYIPAYRQAVMKLTSLNVATSKVNDVINTSLKLVGKRLENCPSRKTEDAIVNEKIAVSSAQVGQKLKGKKIQLCTRMKLTNLAKHIIHF